MTRAQSLIAVSAFALLAATSVASAAPFNSTGHDGKSAVQKIDYQRCWIEDGEEVCRIVSDYDEPDDDVYIDDDVYAYEPGPPVILGFGIGGGGHGHGHGHGGHGHHR